MRSAVLSLAVLVTLLAPHVARACVDDTSCDRGQLCVDDHCSWPKRIETWRRGEPIPDGYRVVEEHRDGLLVGGSLTLAIGLAILLAGASQSSSGHDDSGKTTTVALGALMAVTGLSLFFFGLPTHPVLVRDGAHANEPRVYGAALGVRF